jgi:hypothetical protein
MSGNTPEGRDRLTLQVFAIAQRIMSALFKSDLKAEEVETCNVQELGSIARDAGEMVINRLRGKGDGRIIDVVITSNEISLRPVGPYPKHLFLVRPVPPDQKLSLGKALEEIDKYDSEVRCPIRSFAEIGEYRDDLWRSRIKSIIAVDLDEEQICQMTISESGVDVRYWNGIEREFDGRDWFLVVRKED